MAGQVSAGDAFDFIVVGAGSAGAALAGRLTADGRHRVLVLEAGGSDRHPWLRMPIGYGKAFYDTRFNWKYSTQPVPGLGGRRSYWPRGKVLGGSSSINAMVWVRGHPEDYDGWAAEAPGWSWAEVAPVFERLEDWSGAPAPGRGPGGPVPVRDIARDVHPLCRTYLAAAAEAGLAINPDYNSGGMDGAGIYQITTRDGLRASAATSYLRPARKRPNLCVETHAHVTRLRIEDGRATGVTFRRGGRHGQDVTVQARREVILAAGAVNSPQILMLSGIGPADHLHERGISPVAGLPDVGRNLQDHLGTDSLYRARVPTLNQQLRPWTGRIGAGLRYLLRRDGPLSLSVNQGGGFHRLRPGPGRPDLQLYFSPLSYTRAPAGKRPLMSPDRFPGFLLGTNPCRPTSRGTIGLRSADPFDAPDIHPNYLDTEEDRRLMVEGIRLTRRIAAAPALAQVIEAELLPGPGAIGDDNLAAYARDHAWTVFHPCGTCRMGADPARSVVDPRLRVRGIRGLRVADASVFPIIPSGNTNAPAIMVGEKAADLILQDTD